MPYGRLTWMLRTGRNRVTECDGMRNFLLNVKGNKEPTALMDYGDHFPTLKQHVFVCDIHWNLTDSTDIKIIKIELEVF